MTAQNPWTGVVHAYTMPVPRAPHPSTFGPRPATHQAFFAAPQHGASTVYHAPPAHSGYYPNPALLAALQSAPAAGSYGGGGDWSSDVCSSDLAWWVSGRGPKVLG